MVGELIRRRIAQCRDVKTKHIHIKEEQDLLMTPISTAVNAGHCGVPRFYPFQYSGQAFLSRHTAYVYAVETSPCIIGPGFIPVQGKPQVSTS